MCVGQMDGQVAGLLVALGVAAWVAGIWWFVACMRACPLPYPGTFWWMLAWVYCRLLFRLRRVGPCTVPAEGPVVVVANHTSGIDPVLLVAAIPWRVPAFMVAEEFSDPPVFGRVVRMIECIPVRRDGQDTGPTRVALRRLKAGKMLAIFIEGRIPRPGEVGEAKDGATVLAVHGGAVVVPVHISGTVWTPTVLGAFLRPHKVVVRFGEPIDLRKLAGRRPDKETVSRISVMLLERIRALATQRQGRAVPVPLAGED